MAETPVEETKELETTPYVDWIIPQQDKLERVIDARLAKHAENEKPAKKTARSTADKDENKS